MTDELTLRNRLLDAIRGGHFLEAVYGGLRSEEGGADRLSGEIIKLHNEGLIDAVVEFGALRNPGLGGPDFFLTRYVFEKALPYLNSSVGAVMPCILVLCKEAGQDLAAGTIFNAYVDFCTKEGLNNSATFGENRSSLQG